MQPSNVRSSPSTAKAFTAFPRLIALSSTRTRHTRHPHLDWASCTAAVQVVATAKRSHRKVADGSGCCRTLGTNSSNHSSLSLGHRHTHRLHFCSLPTHRQLCPTPLTRIAITAAKHLPLRPFRCLQRLLQFLQRPPPMVRSAASWTSWPTRTRRSRSHRVPTPPAVRARAVRQAARLNSLLPVQRPRRCSLQFLRKHRCR